MIIKKIITVNNKELDQVISLAFRPYKTLYKIKQGQNKNTIKYDAIGIFVESKLIGSLSYYKEKDILRLFKIAIKPNNQNKGYFTYLVNHVEQIAKEMNIYKLGLYTIKETKSYKYFEKKGFKIISESIADFVEPIITGKALHELEMIKSI